MLLGHHHPITQGRMEEEEEVNGSEQDEDLEAQVEPLLARQRLAIIHLKLRQTISQTKLNVVKMNKCFIVIFHAYFVQELRKPLNKL